MVCSHNSRRASFLLRSILIGVLGAALSCASVPTACKTPLEPLGAVTLDREGWFWFRDAVVYHDLHAWWIGPKELLTDEKSEHLPSKLLVFYDPSAPDCAGSDRHARMMLHEQFPVVSGRGRWNHERAGLEVDCLCSAAASGLTDMYGRFRGLTY